MIPDNAPTWIKRAETRDADVEIDSDAGAQADPKAWKGLTVLREPNGEISYPHIDTIREKRAI